MKSPIQILKDAAASPTGLTVKYFRTLAGERDALLAADYPNGLRGLVRKEIVSSPRQPRQPCFRFFATEVGRKLLRDLESNPDAVPNIPRGNQGFVSAQARVLAERRNNKRRWRNKVKDKNRAKYDESHSNPQYSQADYDELPETDISPNSPDFKNLPPLERIRLLRQQSGRSKPEAN
jgi:hypothetical protein